MRKPYHIVAPAYTELSAGVKALHMLCDALNKTSERAFIVPMDTPVVSPSLNTPIALKNDPEAIVVYPEIIEGNPLQAKNVVRWLLYYAGAYRGNKTFPETDSVWGYTTRIAKNYGAEDVLMLPTVDDTVFVPPDESLKPRQGSCYYAHKYRMFYGGTPSEFLGGVEITNPGQSREELVRLLQSSEVFYAYEDTALIMEAVLCGCPVVCVPSGSFKGYFGMDDFRSGIAEDMSCFGVALDTIRDARKNYRLLQDRFWYQLKLFVERTQADG